MRLPTRWNNEQGADAAVEVVARLLLDKVAPPPPPTHPRCSLRWTKGSSHGWFPRWSCKLRDDQLAQLGRRRRRRRRRGRRECVSPNRQPQLQPQRGRQRQIKRRNKVQATGTWCVFSYSREPGLEGRRGASCPPLRHGGCHTWGCDSHRMGLQDWRWHRRRGGHERLTRRRVQVPGCSWGRAPQGRQGWRGARAVARCRDEQPRQP